MEGISIENCEPCQGWKAAAISRTFYVEGFP